MRSANAPSISAGVMIANIPWNMTNTYSGMVPDSESGVTPARPTFAVSPMNIPSPLKARL
jgi:hypothetical protein